MKKQVAIIGGGAAGVFAAILLSENKNLQISIFEKTTELLKKVRISGGGRCNVTHQYSSPAQFSKNYPRGSAILKKNFNFFSPLHMIAWLEHRKVTLKTEADGRIFPTSDDSQTIIDAFLQELKRENISIFFNQKVESICLNEDKIQVELADRKNVFDYVVVATGGAQKEREMDFLKSIDVKIISPVPSLFTFKIQDKWLTELMGLSVSDVSIKIIGSKYQERGPLLITHWGLTGPAVLKLSSWAAFHLHALDYKFQIQINWLGDVNEEITRKDLQAILSKNGQGMVSNYKPAKIPSRLWLYFLNKAEISNVKKWVDISKKEMNKLVSILTNSLYEINGKTTYKEEFVNAGGIDTESLDAQSMSLKMNPKIYFIGEITNIDGITGGFNFQNAWTSAAVCANDLLHKIKKVRSEEF